jgi:hypothetical protein
MISLIFRSPTERDFPELSNAKNAEVLPGRGTQSASPAGPQRLCYQDDRILSARHQFPGCGTVRKLKASSNWNDPGFAVPQPYGSSPNVPPG